MEKEPHSPEQIDDESVDVEVEYPPFDPERAEKLNKIYEVFWEQKKNFLENAERMVQDGELPEQLRARENELWGARPNIVEDGDFKTDDMAASCVTSYVGRQDKMSRTHNVNLPINILEMPENEHVMEHEMSHALEGHSEKRMSSGLQRLVTDSNSHLAKCLNEGMTEHIAEIVSGRKPNYGAIEKNGKTTPYHVYYDFITFLCTRGTQPINIKSFTDAYILDGEDGERAIVELREQITAAFPTNNGSHPLDNLASHNEAQVEYWLASYTGYEDRAKTLAERLGYKSPQRGLLGFYG